MRPKGTIYKFGKSPARGEVRIFLPYFTRLFYHTMRAVGGGLVAFVIVLLLTSFAPIVRQEVNYQMEDKSDYEVNEMLVNLAEADKIIQVQNEAESYGVGSYFSVVVPKIDAASDIIANVDTSVKEEYTMALMKGVAHARGTFFPGQGENIFVFAHSTDSPINFARYNAVFFLLRKLEEGDKIIVFFADKKYIYEVEKKYVAGADDTSWLTEDFDGERLLLMTCDPPGTTWRRLIIEARPVI